MARGALRGDAILVLAILATSSACDTPEVVGFPDASRRQRDAQATRDGSESRACARDDECDDGVFCNGVEACVEGRCESRPVDCDDGLACTVDACSADLDICTHRAVDRDGDGYGDAACVDRRGVPRGQDCDDDDPGRSPGAVEVCDDEGRDEDCNLATRGGRDEDGDGFEDARCCNPVPLGRFDLNCGTDCDDREADVRPGAQELCNGRDDNCNAVVDEGCICTPGATRSCPRPGACAAGVETCVDGRTYSACSIMPRDETCNGVDDDCDGAVDETTTIACYRDFDDDGYPTSGPAVPTCPDETRVAFGRCPRLFTHRAPEPSTLDCCDFDPRAFPGQTRAFASVNGCGSFDFDCDGRETITLTETVSGIRCSAASVSEAACRAADMAAGSAPGFWREGGPPPCGVSALWLAACQWLRGGIEAPSDTCFPAASSRVQECR